MNLDWIARPFGMLLMFLYDVFSNYGVAIVLFAVVIKVILLPFQMKSKRGMIQQTRLQPKLAELQKKHGTNKTKLNEETMKLYKEEGVNPASGCLWGFLPLPIMLALFQAIRFPLTMMMGLSTEAYGQIKELLATLTTSDTLIGEGLYVQIAQSQFISNAQNFSLFQNISENLRQLDYRFLGLDFSITPNWQYLWSPNAEALDITWFAGFVLFLIPIISGGMQFLATGLNKKMNPTPTVEGQAKTMNSVMMLMPLFSVYIGFITPAALGFYWTISTVLQVIQDTWLTKVYTKKIDAEEAIKNEERKRKEEEIEAKRLETERKKAEGIVERNPNTSKRKKQKSDRQGQIEKTAEWQKKNAPAKKEGKNEPGRVGNRRYARGRAYDPDRYGALAADMSDDPDDRASDAQEDDYDYESNEASADGQTDTKDRSYDDEHYDEDDDSEDDDDYGDGEYLDDDNDEDDEDEYYDEDDDSEDDDDYNDDDD